MAFRYMCLDMGEVTFEYGGSEPYCCPATTGVPGVMNSSLEDKGPIPPGEYILDPHSETYSHVEGEKYIARRLVGDWGHYRVKLEPSNVANLHGRSEFFLHGGDRPGSAGCIDVGPCERKLFPLIEDTNKNDGTDNILVIVTNTPNAVNWTSFYIYQNLFMPT